MPVNLQHKNSYKMYNDNKKLYKSSSNEYSKTVSFLLKKKIN